MEHALHLLISHCKNAYCGDTKASDDGPTREDVVKALGQLTAFLERQPKHLGLIAKDATKVIEVNTTCIYMYMQCLAAAALMA